MAIHQVVLVGYPLPIRSAQIEGTIKLKKEIHRLFIFLLTFYRIYVTYWHLKVVQGRTIVLVLLFIFFIKISAFVGPIALAPPATPSVLLVSARFFNSMDLFTHNLKRSGFSVYWDSLSSEGRQEAWEQRPKLAERWFQFYSRCISFKKRWIGDFCNYVVSLPRYKHAHTCTAL